MNLTKLFEAQKSLDERIIEEKGLDSTNIFTKKILALITEMGECANEHRGFKYWSEDQEPRTNEKMTCDTCLGTGVVLVPEGWVNCHCTSVGPVYQNPLLEEYVDLLHFALSLNLYVWSNNPGTVNVIPRVFDTVEEQFIEIAGQAYNLYHNADVFMHSGLLLANVLGLGQVLGFTDEQIEAAYFAKNATNHRRQEEHY